MWKLLLSVTFYQICWLPLLVILSANGEGEEQWRIEGTNYLTGQVSPGLQTLLPVTTLQQPVEDLETSPARNTLRVVPGPEFRYRDSDQSSQATMFLPKKEDEYRTSRSQVDNEPSRANTQVVTKWGHSDDSHHPKNFPQELEEDNEKASSDPVYYAYEYKVHDPLTGDVKGHKELRDGDRVKGYYMLHDADGSMREVHYTADDEVGFTAVVSKTDDVAPPHKPKLHQDDTFNHEPKLPPKSLSFHGNGHQTHSSINHESTRDRPSQSFFTQPFHNPRDEPHKNTFNTEEQEQNLNSPIKTGYNYENDEEARHVEHFHPTPSYEDAYNNFAKKQPMPVLQDDWHPHSNRELNNDDSRDHESFFGDDEEDFSPFSLNTQNEENYRPHLQVSQYHPVSFQAGGHRSARMHASEKPKEFSSFRPKGAGISINHKNNAHSFQFQDTHPTYETYEDERDYANDESRSTYAIAPSSKAFHIKDNFNAFSMNTNTRNTRPPINSTLLLTSLLPSSPTSFVPTENNYSPNEGSFNPIKKGSFKGSYNSNYGTLENNNFGRFGENIGEVESDISHHSKRNLNPHAGRSQHDVKNVKWSFGSERNLESGFRPIANPFHSPSTDNSQFGSSFFKSSSPHKNNAFKHSTSFSPDNSRFRSFQNNSYDIIGNQHFENTRFPKNKLKKGFFDDGEFGKLPFNSKNGNKRGSDQLRGEYFDDFNADNPKQNYNLNSEFDESMHSVPKRETVKYRMKHGGYPRKGAVRRGNKKPRITSIYDVMAYGGSDWPKKIRLSNNNKKKSRQVFRRFSNRRYNEGKKKRSVLPYEGYFPDRDNVEFNYNKPQPPSLDYEYINSFPKLS